MKNGMTMYQNGMTMYQNGMTMYQNGMTMYQNGMTMYQNQSMQLMKAKLPHYVTNNCKPTEPSVTINRT